MKREFPSFGLDFHTGTLRIALCKKRRHPTLVTAFEQPMKGWDPLSPTIENPEALGKAIRTTFHDQGLKLPRYTVVTLPDVHCFLLLLSLKKTERRDLPEAIRWEAGQHLPYAYDDVCLDWQVVGPTEDGGSLVQVAAAPKTLVGSYLAVLDAASLTPISLEIASLASLRSLALPNDGLPYMLAFFEEAATTLLLISQKGVVASVGTTIFSGQRLTALLADSLKLQPGDAVKARSICGFDRGISRGIVRVTLMGELKRLLGEIDRLHLFAERTLHLPCKTLLITGESSNIRNLEQTLGEESKLGVARALPYPSILPGDSKETLASSDIAYGFSSVLGAALYGMPL